MSSLGEHLHHRVLGVLVDGVVPEALSQVLLNHLCMIRMKKNGTLYCSLPVGEEGLEAFIHHWGVG